MSVSGSQCRDVKLAQRRNVVMSRCHDVMLVHNVALLSLLFTLCIASDGRWACCGTLCLGVTTRSYRISHQQGILIWSWQRLVVAQETQVTDYCISWTCYINLSFLYHFDIIFNPHAQILHVIVLVNFVRRDFPRLRNIFWSDICFSSKLDIYLWSFWIWLDCSLFLLISWVGIYSISTKS